MNTAFLFPGQGAQTVGMGADVAQAFPAAAEIFARASDIIGFDLKQLCFEGPAEQLNATAFSQPAIFVTSAAILEVLRTAAPTAGLKPDVTAGLSLGEYAALYAAGVISFDDAFRLVQKRGQAMQAAADASEGGMVSIIGLDGETVASLCSRAGAEEGELLEPVNFNCPGQIVVSGTKAACRRAKDLADHYGAIKAVRLDVAGAFHTEMMAPAADELAKALAQTRIAEATSPKVIRNIDAEFYTTAESVRGGLTAQLTCPILWQKCMERLLTEGIERYYEIGPGRVLTGLMKRINRKAKVVNISNLQAIQQLLSS